MKISKISIYGQKISKKKVSIKKYRVVNILEEVIMSVASDTRYFNYIPSIYRDILSLDNANHRLTPHTSLRSPTSKGTHSQS